MAQIDVSELLLDPDFIDNLSLIRRTSTISDFGQLVLTESTIDTVGSVQPTTGRDLARLPEALRMADVRTCYIKAEVVMDGTTQYPDLILFRGLRYQVQTTKPWLNWGAGWNECICVAEKVTT